MDLGREVEIEAGGRTWRLGRLTVDVLFGFRDWIKDQVGDPFARLDRVLDRLPKEEALAAIREADDVCRQLERFSMQCPLAREWMNTELGAARMFQLLLLRHHPQATMDDGLLVAMELGRRGQVEAALARSQGSAGGGPGNPEAPGASTSPSRRGLKTR